MQGINIMTVSMLWFVGLMLDLMSMHDRCKVMVELHDGLNSG